MLIEHTNTETNWGDLVGTILDGGYELQELVEADGSRGRFKVRVLGDRGIEAFAKVFRAEQSAAVEQIAIWEAAKKFQQTNLATPLSAGRIKGESSEVVYGIFRKPDETLSGVLRERALTKEEAAEVLLSASRGLGHLHEQGFVHGCLSPGEIFAMGDAIQISTECIRRVNTKPVFSVTTSLYTAPESVGENIMPSADVWCLGATLFEVLTQKTYTAGANEQIAALPMPFRLIVQRCVDPNPESRCKLADLPRLVKGEKMPPVAKSVPIDAEVGPVLQRRRAEAEPQATRMKSWVYVAIALVAAWFIVWAARPKHTIANNSAATVKKTKPESAWETRTLAPDGNAATANAPVQPVKPVPTPPISGPKTINGPVWRVILFTYNREDDAKNKAQAVNTRHPKLNAQVFAPGEHGGPYLVTAGAGMSREEAARLRKQAIGLGMPRDSYIQNYKR